MFKKRFFKAATALACIATLVLPHTSVVLAAGLTNEKNNSVNQIELISLDQHEGGEESTGSLSESAEDKYDTKPYAYRFGGDSGTKILKILREDDKDNGKYQFSDAFYCLDGAKSFPSAEPITYNRTIEDFFAENPTILGLSSANYNSLCWLFNNMYLRKQMTAEQRAEQKDAILTAAFKDVLEDTTYEDRTTLDDLKATITDDDIEVIQQWATWYFTNYGTPTLQGVPFTNENKTLPMIDLGMANSYNAMEQTRKQWLEVLYQYFVNTALTYSNKETEASSSTYPTIANRNITCVVDGENYKIGPFKVTAPSADLTSNDYQITLTDGTNEIEHYNIVLANDIESGTVTVRTLNGIFDEEYYIYLPVNGNTIQNVKLNLSYTKFGTKASVWQADRNDYQPLVLLTKEGEPVKDEVSVKINKPNYDLALRKYIVAKNDTEIKDRTPNVDISKLKDGTSTTAEYKHKKEAVQVKVGDTITYRISVYNEGNIDAKATEIVDYLPEGLELVTDNETNKKFAWNVSNDGTIATTTITKDTTIPAFGNDLKGLYVDIVCKVTDKATSGAVLTNIAEIKSDDIDDRDSTPDSIKDKINSIDKPSYTGKDNKSDLSDSDYYYKGQEDDDDFEKLLVEGKAFDLSLQKFITKVNGKELAEKREPVVDTTPLKNASTNAEYKTVKTPVLVREGDIVTYTIRVYNEGETDGYAESIADYIPDGLGYLVNYNDNINNAWAIKKGKDGDGSIVTVKLNKIQNGTSNLKIEDFNGIKDLNEVDVLIGSTWESEDKSCYLTTNLLNSSKESNLIKAYDGSDKLDYKDVQITCIVLGSVAGNTPNLTNYSEVMDAVDKEKNKVTDRDSNPDNNKPWNISEKNEMENGNDDDWDYEPLTMKKFDLSLQKFITGVNDKEIKDREPKISYKDEKISYEHPQTPLEVNNGDNVTYTIRVYNEGGVDGYAAEIGDDIPSGLVFDSNNETNKKYGWKMIDANGKETTDSSKAVEIRTDYLSKEKSEARKESALLKAFDSEKGSLFYLDVKAVFKVSTKSSDSVIVNTAEITKDTDSEGNEVEDIDSTTDNKKDGEDDLDKEKIHVGYFDLALKKDLVKAVITEGDRAKEIPANGDLTKVEIHRKKINSTIVKFVYNITITNEGTIPGYAKEIKDYIPEGLQFVEADNKNWKASADGVITSEALADKLLNPGESASVEVVLRWINNENNLGMKTNVAEISKDYNDANDTDDIDSTPDNKKDGEDDIDNAPVILSISTGRAPVYIVLTTAVLTMISTGVVMIKKYVL